MMCYRKFPVLYVPIFNFSDERTSGKGGETRIPGWGEPYDEVDHQLTLQEQGGKRMVQYVH